MITPINGQSLTLATAVSSTAGTFRTVGRFTKTNAGTYTVGEQLIVMSPNTDNEERMYINVTSNPTVIDATLGIYEYTITTRGIDSDNVAIPPTLTSAARQKAHAKNSTVAIVISSEYFQQISDQFTSNTTSEVIASGSGEAFTTRDQLSLHTDGLHYKYHSSNYPRWVGTALSITTGAAETFTLAKPGYQVTGYTGLTIGARQYAENTGATTETPSATTTYIGVAETATQILLHDSAPPIAEASEVQARGGTVQSVYNSPLRTFQAIQEGTSIYAADAEASDTYVITLTPAPTALTTGMQIKFKANTINTGAATLNVNALGAVAITKNGTTALEDGDIAAGQVVTVVYDGTQFQLQTPSASLSTNANIVSDLSFSSISDTGQVTSANIGSFTASADGTYMFIATFDILKHFTPDSPISMTYIANGATLATHSIDQITAGVGDNGQTLCVSFVAELLNGQEMHIGLSRANSLRVVSGTRQIIKFPK